MLAVIALMISGCDGDSSSSDTECQGGSLSGSVEWFEEGDYGFVMLWYDGDREDFTQDLDESGRFVYDSLAPGVVNVRAFVSTGVAECDTSTEEVEICSGPRTLLLSEVAVCSE